ncbi:hypothetical protein [Mycobacterium lacus]|uniref:hypothetical protein n=1 Tax=Mycobacterium lacus TaxID=169765 RepID=UPI001E5E2C77|nr:hypothetical protein [Mycobacterium lacus]
MTSLFVAEPPKMKHPSGPSILLAAGMGFVAICGVGVGVARATGEPQVRYEVSGSSPVAD